MYHEDFCASNTVNDFKILACGIRSKALMNNAEAIQKKKFWSQEQVIRRLKTVQVLPQEKLWFAVCSNQIEFHQKLNLGQCDCVIPTNNYSLFHWFSSYPDNWQVKDADEYNSYAGVIPVEQAVKYIMINHDKLFLEEFGI